jgi:NTE family protein
MGVSVSTISGTSIGAIIGALYSSGMPAKQIRQTINKMIERPHSLEEARASRRLFGWLDLLGVEFGRSHLLADRKNKPRLCSIRQVCFPG